MNDDALHARIAKLEAALEEMHDFLLPGMVNPFRAPNTPVTPPEPESAPEQGPAPQNAATGQPGATKRGCDSCRHPKSGHVALCWACVIAEHGPTNWEAP